MDNEISPSSASPTAKQRIRREVFVAREGLSAKDRAAFSTIIAHRIAALPSFIEARTVMLFFSFGSEWASSLLIHQALRLGKTVVLPRVLQSAGPSKTLALHTVDNLVHDTISGMLGIREPRPERPVIEPAAIEWVLVPGLAFTPHGDRLGYGAGLYDRLLPRLSPAVPRIAGAFDVQVVGELPADAHDCPVDAVHTESRVFHCRRRDL